MNRRLDVSQMPTKTCSRCTQVKELTEFGVDNRRNNPKAICKACDREVHRLRYYDPEAQESVILQRVKASKRGLSIFAKKKAAGICYGCDQPADAGLYCSRHAAERRDREAERRKTRVRFCPDCKKVELAPMRKRCDSCADTRGRVWAAKQRAWRDKERRIAFDAYGGAVCACCGEDGYEFLTIDHIHNDGAKHRKEIGLRGHFQRWLKRNKYPPGFQVLCFNCNCAKQYSGTGICPHKTAAQ